MQFFLILALLVALLAVVFALQNVTMVSISFFAWTINVSLAVALLVSLGIGVLISGLISIPEKVKSGWRSSRKNKIHSSLEEERDSLKQKIDDITAEREILKGKLTDSEKEIADLELKLANFAAALHDVEGKLSTDTPLMAEPPQDKTFEEPESLPVEEVEQEEAEESDEEADEEEDEENLR